MKKLIATTELNYAGRDLKAGESFEASDDDSFILTNVGKAKVAPKSDVVQSESTVDHVAVTTRKGRYHRRDMRAKD